MAPAPAGLTTAFWTTYVRVEGLDDALAKATAAGGSVVAGPLDGPDGRIGAITDPTGVPVGLAERIGAELVNAPARGP